MLPASSMEADTLAHLALKAATELDRLERKGHSDLASVTQFVDALSHLSSAADGANARPLLFMDPLSSEVLSEAVRSTVHHNVSSVDALTQELMNVTAEMRELSQAGAQTAALKSLKSFCLFIHDFVQKNRMTNSLTEKGVFDYDHSFAG